MLRAFLQALGIITIKQNAVAIKPTALPVAPPQGRNDAFYETMPVAPKASKVEPYFSGIMSIRQIYDMCKKEGCRDAVMTTTMAMIESGGNPRAVRFEDHLDDYSYGLLQTLYVNSAKWLQKEKGFKRYTLKSPQDLFYPNISIYFGDAVVRWLKKSYKKAASEEWTVRAYNGGPGWESSSYGRTNTLNHWKKYQAMKPRVLKEIGR